MEMFSVKNEMVGAISLPKTWLKEIHLQKAVHHKYWTPNLLTPRPTFLSLTGPHFLVKFASVLA